MPEGRVFEAQVATTGQEVRAILQKSLLSISDLYMKLYTHSGGDFMETKLRKQLADAIILPESDSTMYFVSSQTSQCDLCGNMSIGLPKMLTCGGCRGYHYCGQECQKIHWKRVHKKSCMRTNISKAHFRVTDICVKILSTLSINWDNNRRKIVFSEDNFVCDHIRDCGLKDNINMPIYDTNRLLYVPMPLKVVGWMLSEANKDGPGTFSPDTATKFFGKSDCVVLLVPTTSLDENGHIVRQLIMKETFITLPWASK